MGTTKLSTSGIVDFLERAAPDRINELRDAHQAEAKTLSVAKDLGLGDVDFKQVKFEPTQRAALIDLLRSSVGKLKEQSEKLIQAVRKKMVIVNRTKMIGGVIATASGAIGAFLVHLDVGEAGTALASAFIAMLGGLATLFADYFEKAPSGLRIASAEEHGHLVEIQTALDQIERRIQRYDILVLSDQDLEEMVKAVDDYAERVVRLSFV